MEREEDLALALEEQAAVSRVVAGLQERLVRKGKKKDEAAKEKGKSARERLGSSTSFKITKKGSSTVSTRQLIKATSSVSADNIKVKREELNRKAREEAALRRQAEKELSKEDRDKRKARREEERRQKREDQKREREERKEQRALDREKKKLERVMAMQDTNREVPLAAAAKEVKEKMKGLDRAQSKRDMIDQMRAKKTAEKAKKAKQEEAKLREVAIEMKEDEERLHQETAEDLELAKSIQKEAELLLKQ